MGKRPGFLQAGRKRGTTLIGLALMSRRITGSAGITREQVSSEKERMNRQKITREILEQVNDLCAKPVLGISQRENSPTGTQLP